MSALDLVGANCAVWRERFLRGEQFTPHEAHNFLRDARLLCEEARVQHAELARLRAENADLREELAGAQDKIAHAERESAAACARMREQKAALRAENERLRALVPSEAVLDTLGDALAEHRDRMSMWEGRRDHLITEAEAASEWVAKVEAYRREQRG